LLLLIKDLALINSNVLTNDLQPLIDDLKTKVYMFNLKIDKIKERMENVDVKSNQISDNDREIVDKLFENNTCHWRNRKK
jgi:hypothetical protein